MGTHQDDGGESPAPFEYMMPGTGRYRPLTRAEAASGSCGPSMGDAMQLPPPECSMTSFRRIN